MKKIAKNTNFRLFRDFVLLKIKEKDNFFVEKRK